MTASEPVGVGPAFFVNSVSFVAVILTLGRLDARGLPARTVRATIFAVYNFAYSLLYFRTYPRVDISGTTPSRRTAGGSSRSRPW